MGLYHEVVKEQIACMHMQVIITSGKLTRRKSCQDICDKIQPNMG